MFRVAEVMKLIRLCTARKLQESCSTCDDQQVNKSQSDKKKSFKH